MAYKQGLVVVCVAKVCCVRVANGWHDVSSPRAGIGVNHCRRMAVTKVGPTSGQSFRGRCFACECMVAVEA